MRERAVAYLPVVLLDDDEPVPDVPEDDDEPVPDPLMLPLVPEPLMLPLDEPLMLPDEPGDDDELLEDDGDDELGLELLDDDGDELEVSFDVVDDELEDAGGVAGGVTVVLLLLDAGGVAGATVVVLSLRSQPATLIPSATASALANKILELMGKLLSRFQGTKRTAAGRPFRRVCLASSMPSACHSRGSPGAPRTLGSCVREQ